MEPFITANLLYMYCLKINYNVMNVLQGFEGSNNATPQPSWPKMGPTSSGNSGKAIVVVNPKPSTEFPGESHDDGPLKGILDEMVKKFGPQYEFRAEEVDLQAINGGELPRLDVNDLTNLDDPPLFDDIPEIEDDAIEEPFDNKEDPVPNSEKSYDGDQSGSDTAGVCKEAFAHCIRLLLSSKYAKLCF